MLLYSDYVLGIRRLLAQVTRSLLRILPIGVASLPNLLNRRTKTIALSGED